MCTNLVQRAIITGSAKGARGWIHVNAADVSYDHPFHAPLEHTLNIDFVDSRLEPGDRVAVELSPASARELMRKIMAVLERGETEQSADRGGPSRAQVERAIKVCGEL
jgi:hypothetical protein